jgi:hypothetical protein
LQLPVVIEHGWPSREFQPLEKLDFLGGASLQRWILKKGLEFGLLVDLWRVLPFHELEFSRAPWREPVVRTISIANVAKSMSHDSIGGSRKR